MGNPRERLADTIFCAFVNEDSSAFPRYKDGEEIRSAAFSDTVDVKIEGQWYRISSESIDEPISLKEHHPDNLWKGKSYG
jgi:hypothetical protein